MKSSTYGDDPHGTRRRATVARAPCGSRGRGHARRDTARARIRMRINNRIACSHTVYALTAAHTISCAWICMLLCSTIAERDATYSLIDLREPARLWKTAVPRAAPGAREGDTTPTPTPTPTPGAHRRLPHRGATAALATLYR